MKPCRLKKSRHTFRQALKRYRKKKNRLPEETRKAVAQSLENLQMALIAKDREKASSCARAVHQLYDQHLKKNPFERIRDFIFGLAAALVIAVLIRTMWFELYEIPTGSMRPTLQEKDHLVVSKTAFGINIPLKRGHFYFDPDLIKRNQTIIFTGAGMDIADVDTIYFYLFPGKKQFVKRLIGKPGDTLYFYGGEIYGIDREGKDISRELQSPSLANIDHVPFIHFNGRMEVPAKNTGGIFTPITVRQMNLPVAKLELSPSNKPTGHLLPPYALDGDYFDLWGFKDFGMGRLLTKEEVLKYTSAQEGLSNAPLYMEIAHHPSAKHPKIERDHMGRLVLGVGITHSVLPLTEKHLKALQSHLYTARFIVKGGKASRYGSSMKAGNMCTYCPTFKDVPDGTYQFYYGKGYKVLFGGTLKELPKDHPLYTFSPEKIQLLYNLGIEFHTYYSPHQKEQYFFPSRYVYYRDGALYTMGAPFIEKDDPTLTHFIQSEEIRAQNAPSYRPHFPFVDPKPPLLEDGSLDIPFIKKYGLTLPDKEYLCLGDNYAMSADSRDFGFVPEENLRGSPSYIFWPIGNRLGPINQTHPPFFNTPRAIIWTLAFIGFGTYYLIHRKKTKLPQNID
ncbi:MAG: signal peptidase I [Chlamydiia bacterium]|nr:signal peptidase I [Chlamydiia bacterium]